MYFIWHTFDEGEKFCAPKNLESIELNHRNAEKEREWVKDAPNQNQTKAKLYACVK